ncbi:50S ribosome-binding GTPase [Planomonospora sp. ID82291]|nr:50S ribosome-binding GTPase [Planomonospora sp. ID82291]
MQEKPLPDEVSEALTEALAALRGSVTDLVFGLDLPGVEEARKARAEILAQLDDYVIPRIHMSTAPALIVVAGSTGAGKSTLLNTLANANVSPTGVRRPTTGTPVLACHPDDREWFAEGGPLGSLERREAAEPGTAPDGLVLVSTERLPPGVALLDTPDIDSVVEAHHEIAHRMLDAADLWIFVTTAARYADAPAWRLLRLAKERGARLAIVLSRVPARSREVVTKHFVRMLTEYGLGQVDRFVINESTAADGMLPDHEVTELRLWLTELSVDDRRRAQAVQATLAGVLDSFRARVPALARQLEVQLALRADLRGDVDAAYGGAMAEIDEATRNGSLLRGEVLARWQDFIGSGDLMRTLHLRKPGRFAGKASRQGPERLSALKTALRAGLEAVVVSAAQRAAEETVSRWLNRPGAGEALAVAPGLGEPSDDLPRRAGRAVAAWQDHLVGLIRTEGVTKRSVARVVSFDAESLALILTIGMFGYGTAEIEVAGKSALPQRLLHALLGAESLRSISAKARSDLRTRIGTLFDDEVWRYVQVLDGAGIPDEAAATRLYQAMYNLEVAR